MVKYDSHLYRMQVYHRIAMSLPLGADPCDADTQWEEDPCTLRFLNDLIYSQLNCTTPWLLSFARLHVYRNPSIHAFFYVNIRIDTFCQKVD